MFQLFQSVSFFLNLNDKINCKIDDFKYKITNYKIQIKKYTLIELILFKDFILL